MQDSPLPLEVLSLSQSLLALLRSGWGLRMQRRVDCFVRSIYTYAHMYFVANEARVLRAFLRLEFVWKNKELAQEFRLIGR